MGSDPMLLDCGFALLPVSADVCSPAYSHHKNEELSMKRAFVVLIGLGAVLLTAVPQARAQAVPRYKVDPSWPKDLPNNWLMWNSTGLVVDKDDHIWVQHHPRQLSAQDAGLAFNPPTAECCIPAPTYV